MAVCGVTIGVFDSGVGGLSVANAIRKALPEHQVCLREDSIHVPYGTRTPAEIFGFIVPIFKELIALRCQIIVIACNTVSTTLIEELRHEFPNTALIAIEPMVKPAALLTRTGVIAVCATPTTLASERYAWLKSTYASKIRVMEPDCSQWSSMIEHDQLEEKIIANQIAAVLSRDADVIVLACTHYHWIEEQIVKLVRGQAQVLQPEQPVISELRRVITRLS